MTQASSITCPRCGTESVQSLYGPCPNCRAELIAKYMGRATGTEAAVEAAERVHRTPNFVATKD